MGVYHADPSAASQDRQSLPVAKLGAHQQRRRDTFLNSEYNSFFGPDSNRGGAKLHDHRLSVHSRAASFRAVFSTNAHLDGLYRILYLKKASLGTEGVNPSVILVAGHEHG
jgi:hypothetical protein